MSGSVSISSGSEDDLQSALAYIGPVSVAVDASNTAFRVCTILECLCKANRFFVFIYNVIILCVLIQ